MTRTTAHANDTRLTFFFKNKTTVDYISGGDYSDDEVNAGLGWEEVEPEYSQAKEMFKIITRSVRRACSQQTAVSSTKASPMLLVCVVSCRATMCRS